MVWDGKQWSIIQVGSSLSIRLPMTIRRSRTIVPIAAIAAIDSEVRFATFSSIVQALSGQEAIRIRIARFKYHDPIDNDSQGCGQMSFLYLVTRRQGTVGMISLAVGYLLTASSLLAQSGQSLPPAGTTKVTKTNESVQMIINSSHMLTLDDDIERASVHNEAVLAVRPMARNELLVSAQSDGGNASRSLRAQQTDLQRASGRSRRLTRTGSYLTRRIPDLRALRATDPKRDHRQRTCHQRRTCRASGGHRRTILPQRHQPDPSRGSAYHHVAYPSHGSIANQTASIGIDWELLFGNDSISSSVAETIGPVNPETGIRPLFGQLNFGIIDITAIPSSPQSARSRIETS